MRRLLADQRRRAEDRRRKTGPVVYIADYDDTAQFWLAFQQRLSRCRDKTERVALMVRELEEAP